MLRRLAEEDIDPGDQATYTFSSSVVVSIYGIGTTLVKTIVGKGADTYQLEIDGNLNVLGVINNQVVTTQITKAWHHIALTYDGSTQKLYVDGALKSSAVLTGSIGTNSNNLKIGEYVPGKIDEVRIYSEALSTSQIQKHYTEGLEKHKNLTTNR